MKRHSRVLTQFVAALAVVMMWLPNGRADTPLALARIVESHPSDGISEPYAVIEYNGNRFKTSETGVRINAMLWDKLPAEDKKSLSTQIYSWRTDWRQEHFGASTSAAIGDWIDTQNGWKEAGQIWSDRIAKREFPELSDFYTQPLVLPPIPTANPLHPSVAKTAAYQEFVAMCAIATQEFNEGKAAFDCLERTKASQIGNATKALSKLIIKDLIVSRVLVPRMLPSPTAEFSDLIAESTDFLLNAAGIDISNIESLYGPQTNPIPIIQAMNTLIEKYRNFATANMDSVKAKLEQLRAKAAALAQNNDDAWKTDHDNAQALKTSSETKVKTAPAPTTYNFVPAPTDDTEEKQHAAITAQANAEFVAVGNDLGSLHTEIQSRIAAALAPIGGADNRYNLFQPVGQYVVSGSMSVNGGEPTPTYYDFYFNFPVDVPSLFTYYPLAKLEQALNDFPDKISQCQSAEDKVQTAREALQTVLDEETPKYQALRAKMLGLNAYYPSYIGYRPSDYLSDADLIQLIACLTDESRSLETYQLELSSVREAMSKVEIQFGKDLNDHKESLRKQLVPYDSLKTNLINSTSMYLGTISQFRKLHSDPAYRPHPASQPYAYYGFSSVQYGNLFSVTYNPIDIDSLNQSITAKTDWTSRLAQGQNVAAQLYKVREQEMNQLHRLEIAQTNIFYDIDTLQELLDGLAIPKVVGKSVYQQNLELAYGHELVQYASGVFSDEIGGDYIQYGYFGSGNSRSWSTYKRSTLSSNVSNAINLLTGQVTEAGDLQDLTATMLAERDHLLTLPYAEFTAAQAPRWRSGSDISQNANLYSPLILPWNSIAQGWYAFNSAYNQIEQDYFNVHANDTFLGSLTVTGGGQQTLTPAFSPQTFSYGVQVDNSVTSVAVNASLSNPTAGAQIAVSGGNTLVEGSNLVTVTVTGSGNVRIYNISVWRQPKDANPELTLLAPDDGTTTYPLGPATMVAGVLRYPVTIPYAVTALNFSWTRAVTTGTSVTAELSPGLVQEAFDPAGSARVSGFAVDALNPGLLTLTSSGGSVARSYTFVIYREADKSPPTWPDQAALTASAITDLGARLDFPEAVDAGTGVAGYRIYRNGATTPVADLPATARSWTATGLALGTTVQFTIEARDAAGNASTRLANQLTTTGTAVLGVTPRSGNLPATGGTQGCQVTSNTLWTATSDEDWLVPTPASGTGDGALDLTATTNPEMTPRQATVTVTAGGVAILVVVTQEAGTAKLVPSPTTVALPSDGGKSLFLIDSNLEWTVEIPAAAASWLTAGPALGRYASQVTLAAPANTSGSPRNATLKVSAAGTSGLMEQTVTVTQSAAGSLPTVVTGTSSNITSSSAILYGTVNPNGQSTTASFDYGLTTAYGGSVSVTLSPADGLTSQSVSAGISGLQAGTTYHYRLTATHSGDVPTSGADMQFVTSGSAPVKTTPKITWANPAAIAYGTALTTTQLNARANVPGQFAYTPPVGSRLPLGTQSLSVTFTPLDTITYATVQKSVSLVVVMANQIITFPAPPSLLYGDADVDLAATASSELTVSYATSNPAVASIVDGNRLHVVGAGSVKITASQPGDANWKPALAVARTLVIGKKPQTITYPTLTGHAMGDADFSPGATASSGLAVTYASSAPAVATIVAGQIHLVGKGTAVITASQIGSANWAAAPPLKQTLVVAIGSQIITFASLPNKGVGDVDFAPGATASSGLTVSYVSSNSKVATIVAGKIHVVGEGSSTITAKQAGNASWTAAPDAAQTFTVGGKAAPVITWANPAAISYGKPLTATQLNAKANVPGTFAYSPASGAQLPVGQQSLSVTFTPNDQVKYNTAQKSVALTVNKTAATVTLAGLSQTYTGQPRVVTATTVPAGLKVVITYADTTVAPTNAASYPVIATIDDPNAAGSKAGTLVVAKGNQTISFASLPALHVGDEDYALTASAASGLPVSYASSNQAVATIAGGSIHAVSTGTAVITATQSGDSNWLAALPVKQTLSVPTDDQDIRAFYATMKSMVEKHDQAGFLNMFAPEYRHAGQDLAGEFDPGPGMLDTIKTFTFAITGITVTGSDAMVAGTATLAFNNGDSNEVWAEPDTTHNSPGIGWLRKTADGWRVVGDQKRALATVQTAHTTTPGDDRYYFQMHTKSSEEITSVSVSGPGIDTTALQPDLEWGGFNAFAGSFTSAQRPAVGTAYAFVVEFGDGSQVTYQDTVKAWVTTGPVVSVTPGANTATIRWTNVRAAVAKADHYWVRVVDGDVYWQSSNLPLTQTSIVFNADGTAVGSLVSGQSYKAQVFIFNGTDDYASRDCYFTMP
jgi:hypothetical protein